LIALVEPTIAGSNLGVGRELVFEHWISQTKSLIHSTHATSFFHRPIIEVAPLRSMSSIGTVMIATAEKM